MENRVRSGKRSTTKDRGTTLVEMLVCFALVGIIMAAAAGLISVTMETYYGIRQTEYGTNMLSRMQMYIMNALETADTKYEITIGQNGSDVDFIDGKGRRVKIAMNEDGYLEVTYVDENTGDRRLWKLDDKAYMGSNIGKLTFFKACDRMPEEYDGNVIGVEVVIKNKVYGESNGTGYVEYPGIPGYETRITQSP